MLKVKLEPNSWFYDIVILKECFYNKSYVWICFQIMVVLEDTYIDRLSKKKKKKKYVNEWGDWLQTNQLSLRNNWLEFKTSGKLLIILEGSIEYTYIKK